MVELMLALAIAGVVIAVLVGLVAAQFWSLRHEVGALRARLDRLEHPEHVEHPAHVEHPEHLPHLEHPEHPEHPAHLEHPEHPEHLEHPAHLETESLENRIGGQWLLYIGVLAILVGVAYFEKLAFENEWMGPAARVIQAGIAGIALVYAGVRFVRAGYRLYGQAIAGAGIAVMYVSAYASFNFYHLLTRPVAFASMGAITVFGALLADRHRSQGLAVLAVGGGFLTPFLLPGTTDAQIALFGYDAILTAGAAALARRRAWGLLYLTSYLMVTITISAWADRFYTPAKYLTTELFLTTFCALFLYMLRRCRGTTDAAMQIAAMFLLTAPAAYYFTSLAVLFDHPLAMLLWLVALMAVISAAAVQRGQRIGLGGLVAVAVPLLVWCGAHGSAEWLTAGLSATAGIYALSLATQLRLGFEEDRPSPPQIAWTHFGGLATYAAVYLLMERVGLPAAGVALAFGVWQGAIAGALWNHRRELATHFVALGATFVAIAIALEFNGAAVTVGWGAEGFALVVLALRERRFWLRDAGLSLFAIAFFRAEALLFAAPRMGQVLLVNRRAACAGFLILLAYGLAWLHRRDEGKKRSWYVGGTIITAQILTLSLVTSEIDSYYLQRGEELTRQVMRSVSWAACSTVLILVGLRRAYAPIRIFAIAVLALTIVKVFAVDLQHLQRAYRVISVIGLGIMLLLSSYLYQRARTAADL